MAAKYYLYTTEYNNTLMERSNTSFAPLPPNTGEILIDYFIPTTQPLYYYRESGSTIVLNDEATISSYLQSSPSDLSPEDRVQIYKFNNFSAHTTNYEGNGLISGFTITVDTGLTTISISEGTGYIVDNTTNPYSPEVHIITCSGGTNLPITYLNTNLVTYVAADKDKNFIQKTSPFTPTERRDYLILGAVIHTNKTTINAINNLPDVVLDSHNQLNDLIDGLKNFNVEGNIFSVNGANLLINKSIGTIFKRGVNFNTDPKNPHIKVLPALTAPSNLRYRLSDGTEYGDTDTIDNLYYESPLGTRTVVSNNKFTVQRFTVFSSNLVRIQYGQKEYFSLVDAFDGITLDPFTVEQNINENGLLRGYLILEKGVTDLSNTLQARFLAADKFGTIPVGSGGGINTLPWGSLTGLISNQTDLQEELDAKLNIIIYSGYTGTTDTRITEIENDIIYVSGITDTKLDTNTFTGYTASTNTSISNIENDITYLSGQTDLRLTISDFNNYTGETDTRLDGIDANILELSGITSGLTGTYVEIDSFTGYTATTDTTLTGLQSQIDALSGVTGLSSIQIRRTTTLTLTATLTNITYDTTDVESNVNVLEHDNTNTDRINVKEDGLYLIMFDSDASNTWGAGDINFEINKNVTNTLLNGGDSTVNLYAGEIHKLTHIILADLNAGDYVTTRINTLSTSSQLNAPITLSMISLKGVKGERGADGATGSGSTIKVYEDGVNVQPTGGTFTTLNFTTGFSLSGGTDQVNIVGETPTAPMILLIDNVGGQDLTNITPVPINWGLQQRISTAYFSHTAGNSTVTILQDGQYEISYNVNTKKDTSNTPATTGVQVRIDGTIYIDTTITAFYQRNAANDDGSNSLPPYPINLYTGEVIELVGFQLGNAAASTTEADQSFFRIKYIGATG